MSQILSDLKNLVFNNLFPITCLVCDKDVNWLCENCAQSLTPVAYQRCIVCQKPSLAGLTHPKCQAPQSPDQLWSLYDYGDPRVADMIVTAKYHFLPGAFSAFGLVLGQALKTVLRTSANRLIVPIPLKASRKRWRGFNQAELIADQTAIQFSAPLHEALVRSKTTKVQKDLNKEDRKLNVRDAFKMTHKSKNARQRIMEFFFQVDRPKPISIIGREILLIDDVVTTGSTLIEAAKVLKRNGARSVICITLAQD